MSYVLRKYILVMVVMFILQVCSHSVPQASGQEKSSPEITAEGNIKGLVIKDLWGRIYRITFDDKSFKTKVIAINAIGYDAGADFGNSIDCTPEGHLVYKDDSGTWFRGNVNLPEKPIPIDPSKIPQSVRYPAFSSDGKMIAYVLTLPNQSKLCIYEVDTDKALTLIDKQGFIEWPTWSPDNARLAYYYSPPYPDRIEDYKGYALTIIELGTDTPQEKQIAPPLKQIINRGRLNMTFPPKWSPDGKQIIFERRYDEKKSFANACIIDSDGKNLASYSYLPDWPADGKNFISVITEWDSEGPTSFKIVSTDRASGKTKELGVLPSVIDTYSFSPDGKMIAFSSPQKGFCVMRLDGSKARKLSDSLMSPSKIYWINTDLIGGRSSKVIDKSLSNKGFIDRYHYLCDKLHLFSGLDKYAKETKDIFEADAQKRVFDCSPGCLTIEHAQFDNLYLVKSWLDKQLTRHGDRPERVGILILGGGIRMNFNETGEIDRILNRLIGYAIEANNENLYDPTKDRTKPIENPQKTEAEIKKQAESYLSELTDDTIKKYSWGEPRLKFTKVFSSIRKENGRLKSVRFPAWEIKWYRKIGDYETEYDNLVMQIHEEYGLHNFYTKIPSEYNPLEIPKTGPVKQVDSKELKQTVITSHMEENIITGTNLVYCSTFQMAWNEFKDNITKEDIEIQDDPPMVNFLNKSLSTKSEISEKDYVAMVGYGRDKIVDKINRALKEKFGDKASPIKEDNLDDTGILAYAFLLKDLPFKYGFDRFGEPVYFKTTEGEIPVKVFGIERKPVNPNYEEVLKQVTTYYNEYNKQDRDYHFIIGLTSTVNNDDIILAKIKPESTLLKTIESVANLMETGKPEVLTRRQGLTVQIPMLDFNIKHSYSELIPKRLLNKGFEDYSVVKAEQNIRFTLNDKGATLISDATFKTLKGGTPRFIFDKPFLVWLKQKGAKYPYFAMWVDNTELMIRDTTKPEKKQEQHQPVNEPVKDE